MKPLQPPVGLIVWTVIWVLLLVLFVIALFNLVRSSFKDSTTKLIWLIVILFVPLIGPSLYLVLGRKQKMKTF